jgi:hypothetical protein
MPFTEPIGAAQDRPYYVLSGSGGCHKGSPQSNNELLYDGACCGLPCAFSGHPPTLNDVPLSQIEHDPESFCGAVITGCRYMELGRMTVSAYDPTNKSVSTVQAKTGKVKHIYLTDEEAVFFKQMAAGKRSTDLLFRQQDGKPWVKSAQQPRMQAALKAADINRHVRFHDLRHTFATWQVAAGTSIQMVANQLGHASTRIAEEHYAHYSPSHIASTARANKPSIVP